MDKQNARLFGATVVITAAIIGGAYLLDRAHQSAQPAEKGESGWTPLSSSQPLTRHPGPDPGPSAPSNTQSTEEAANSAWTEVQRTNSYLVCEHPVHGIVHTNPTSCNDIDMDNRLSYADSFVPVPDRDRYSAKDYQTPKNEAGNSRTNRKEKNQKPSLRLHGKSPPSGLNVSCKNSVGKALEIERDLAATSDPRESIWRDSYCKQRCEAIQENCPVADDYFYYRYRELCPWRPQAYCG